MRGITCALISLTCWYMGSHMSRVNLTIKGALAITAFGMLLCAIVFIKYVKNTRDFSHGMN